MATGSLGLSEYDALLKDWYGEALDLFNNDFRLLQFVSRSTTKWTGRQQIDPVTLERTSGIGARAERGTLPTAGYTEAVQSITTAKYNYAVLEVTGQVLAASKDDRGAFRNALDREMEEHIIALKNDISRQLWGNGRGDLATISGTVSAPTYDVEAPPIGLGVRYVAIGRVVDVVDPGTGTVRGSATVTSVDVTNNTVTLSAAVAGTTAGDILVNSGSYNQEITGMFALSSDGDTASDPREVLTLQNISRATYPQWKGNVLRNPAGAGTARPLTRALMQQAFSTAAIRSGIEPTIIFADYSVRDEYIAGSVDLLSQKRFFNTTALDGGQQQVDFNGIPVQFDKDCPYGEMYFFNPLAIELAELEPLHFDDRDGSILHRKDNTDVYEARLKVYNNLKTLRPHSIVRLDDIQSTVNAVPV